MLYKNHAIRIPMKFQRAADSMLAVKLTYK